MKLDDTHYRILNLLRYGAIVRLGGRWRYGTTWLGDSAVDRLLAAGRVTRLFPGGRGDCIILNERSRGAV